MSSDNYSQRKQALEAALADNLRQLECVASYYEKHGDVHKAQEIRDLLMSLKDEGKHAEAEQPD
jgi:hypothetical protein